MNLESERLILKEITWDDLEDIHKLHSIPQVDEFNTLGIPQNIEETKEVIRPAIEDQNEDIRKKYCWTINIKTNNIFIGLAGLNLSASRFKMGEIYFKLLPPHWGKGYATETARTLIKFGFKDLRLHRIEAGVATGNMKSIRVLEKAGMAREGIRRKILPIRGEWKDNYHYTILEDDKITY